MIIPDLNLILYAHDDTSRLMPAARRWWESILSGTETVGIPWTVILGCVRISTSSRACRTPVEVDTAVGRAEAWLACPNVRIIQAGTGHVRILFGLLRAVGTGANLTLDAHLAALAIEYGAVVHTADADFGRFAGVRRWNPLRA